MKKLFLLFILTLGALTNSYAQKSEFSKEGLSEPLVTPEKGSSTLADILKKHKGKTVVIEVWASWCSDCVKAMPKLKKLQGDHPEVDYVFISMDKADDKWKAGIEKHQLYGDHYWATDGMKGNFGRAIDLDWIPRYIIVNKSGKIVTYRAIETDFDSMDTTLNKLKS
jgi:thiol-disulfide isomerase/thioredoxin